MKNRPTDDEDTEDQDNPSDELPVIDIDADPDNANWLRILAKRREEQARKQQQQPSSQS